MEYITWLISFIMHIDRHLVDIIQQYGTLTYFFMFLIIFCETGLVVTPLLPGDSWVARFLHEVLRSRILTDYNAIDALRQTVGSRHSPCAR